MLGAGAYQLHACVGSSNLLETQRKRNSNLSHSLELKQGSTLRSLYSILVHMSCRCKTASLTWPGLFFLADFGERREASVGIPCFAMAVPQVEFSRPEEPSLSSSESSMTTWVVNSDSTSDQVWGMFSNCWCHFTTDVATWLIVDTFSRSSSAIFFLSPLSCITVTTWYPRRVFTNKMGGVEPQDEHHCIWPFFCPTIFSNIWNFLIFPWAPWLYRFHPWAQIGSRIKGILSNLAYHEFTVGYLWDHPTSITWFNPNQL